MKESNLLKLVLLASSAIKGLSLFRNNVGLGWAGKSRRLKAGENYVARGGELLIYAPRPLHAGLMKGSGDAIGPYSVVVTQEMVGRTVAVFTSVETKVTTKLSEEQENWHDRVKQIGGISIICRSPDDLKTGLDDYFSR